MFVNDAHRVSVVTQQLLDRGIISIASLSGESEKEDRKDILTRMRVGTLQVCVVTEMAARGLDLPRVNMVVNLDFPTDALHYLHR